MDDRKLKWCFEQKRGIRLVDQNQNLAEEYIKSAEETLLVLQNIKEKSNIWLATTKYYCEYFAIYALLMRLGIKSEIHDCTIELCKRFEHLKIIPSGFSKIIEKDKEIRIDNQYYLKNRKVDIKFDNVRDFVLIIKNKINSITNDEIEKIRNNFIRY